MSLKIETREQFLKSRNITSSNASSFCSYGGVVSVEHTSALTVIQRFLDEFLILFYGELRASVIRTKFFFWDGIGLLMQRATHFVPPYKYGFGKLLYS